MKKTGFGVDGTFSVICRDSNGNLKWEEPIFNLIVNGGLDHLLDSTLGGGTQVSTWYLGLTSGTPAVAATDTMASHPGWTEVTGYDEATRIAYAPAAVSSQTITNNASPGVFTASGTLDVGGCFVTSDSTKGGTTGILYAAGGFAGGDRQLEATDQISVTYTCTSADV